MAEPLLSFTHLLAVFGLALLYCILLNTKPTVTAGGAAAATSKRFAIVRATSRTYLTSEVPEDLNQCLTSRWQAGPGWCRGSVCKVGTATFCIMSDYQCRELKKYMKRNEEYILKRREEGIMETTSPPPPVGPTLVRLGSHRSIMYPPVNPPVNEMLEWVEECGWALHSMSSVKGDGEYPSESSKYHTEVYVFARPKAD